MSALLMNKGLQAGSLRQAAARPASRAMPAPARRSVISAAGREMWYPGERGAGSVRPWEIGGERGRERYSWAAAAAASRAVQLSRIHNSLEACGNVLVEARKGASFASGETGVKVGRSISRRQGSGARHGGRSAQAHDGLGYLVHCDSWSPLNRSWWGRREGNDHTPLASREIVSTHWVHALLSKKHRTVWLSVQTVPFLPAAQVPLPQPTWMDPWWVTMDLVSYMAAPACAWACLCDLQLKALGGCKHGVCNWASTRTALACR